MSDAVPLPPRPNLEQYKKLAKDFQRAYTSSDPAAVRNWAIDWAANVARLHVGGPASPVGLEIQDQAARIEQRWTRFKETQRGASHCTLAEAQLFVAQSHGFASWPRFRKHLEALATKDSAVSGFEAAADAIVSGDLERLQKLLFAQPALVTARSTREHRSTLLHYVSANGIEDFRQKTPKNIVEISKLLLRAGADVNAESDAYGGGSTALGLTATSCHPERAGVQVSLMELLLEHGALIDGKDGRSIVNSCLHNGRGQAAEFLANRGARLDLEGAAGVGRLDLVDSLFGNQIASGQVLDAFAWACQFGRTAVVRFFLERGAEVEAKLPHQGQTGLHWAAYGAHSDTVKLLLQHGAALNTRDETYNATPLGWALYAHGRSTKDDLERRGYYETVALLVTAGAEVEPQWVCGEGSVSDPLMQRALRGEN